MNGDTRETSATSVPALQHDRDIWARTLEHVRLLSLGLLADTVEHTSFSIAGSLPAARSPALYKCSNLAISAMNLA